LKLKDSFEKYLTLQKESSKLYQMPSMLFNLRVNENGLSKPLIHLLVEHVTDTETLNLLKKCLDLGFNSNI
jgi:hypothetical protein